MEGSGGQGPFGPGSSGYGPGGAGDDDDERDAERTDTGPEAPPQPPIEDPPAPLWSAPKNAEPPPPPPAGGPQSPAPGGPQSPAPGGPQSPAGPGPQAPPPPPAGPQAPPPAAPGYGGPVPPGDWQQPVSATPALPGQLASWGSRVGATLLDGLIVTVAIVVVVLIIVGVVAANETAGIIVGIILGLATLVASVCYAAFFMKRPGERNGQTLGKQAVGIRAVRDNGEPFGFGQAFLREFVVKGLLFGSVGSFFLYIPTLLDWLWPLWDDSDRCLHDMVVTTHVIRN